MTEEEPQQTAKTTVEAHKQKSSLRVTDAVLLAIASSGAYLLSFLYERGYAKYFGIPPEFINVSLVNLLIFGAGIVSFIVGGYLFFDLVFPFIRPKHPYLAFWAPVIAVLFFIAVLLPLFLFGWVGLWFFLVLLGVWFLVVFIFLVWPLIVHRKHGGWMKRYDKQFEQAVNEAKTVELERVHLQAFIGGRLGYKNFGLLIFLLIQSTILSGAAGNFKAEKQEDFLITNTTPTMVVLRVYGDNMICAPLDRNAKEVKKSFVILKIAEDKKLMLNLEKVGPLKPVEKLTSETITTPTPTSTPESPPTTTPAPVQTETPATEPRPTVAPNSNGK